VRCRHGIPRWHPARGTGCRAAADQKMAARDLTSGAPGASAECGAAPAECRCLCCRTCHKKESHACRSLLSRAPGPSLDRSHVRPCPGSDRELVRRDIPGHSDIPGQPATRRADRPAKDAGGSQSPQPRPQPASAWEGRPELASSYESQARVAVRRCKAASAGGPHVAFPPGRPWTPASPMSRQASALDSAQPRARRRVAASAADG
jgi:hypothetical protein